VETDQEKAEMERQYLREELKVIKVLKIRVNFRHKEKSVESKRFFDLFFVKSI
jgi:hypothetical protein